MSVKKREAKGNNEKETHIAAVYKLISAAFTDVPLTDGIKQQNWDFSK